MAKITHFIQKMVLTDWYPIIIFAMSYYVWSSQPPIYPVAITFMVLFFIVLVFTNASVALLPWILALLFANVFGVDQANLNQVPNLPYPLIYGVIGLVGVLLILYLIRYLLTNRGKNRPKMRLGIGLGAILIAFTLSKARTVAQPLVAFPYIDALIVVIIIAFYFFFLFTNTAESSKPFAKTFAYFGVLVSLQMITYYSSTALGDSFSPNTGWGNPNEGANILLLVLPFSLYLSVEKARYLWPFFFTIIGIILTLSRGGILFMVFALIWLLILLFRKYRKRFYQTIIIFAIIIGITYLFAPTLFLFIFNTILQDGFSDSGRFELYRQAWQIFQEHPWLGIGTTLSPAVFDVPVWFHSTFFDVIASLGVIGLVAFLFHLFQKYFLLFTKRNPFKWFALAGILASEMYGLIDVSYFHFLYFIVLIFILSFVERSEMTEQSLQ